MAHDGDHGHGNTASRIWTIVDSNQHLHGSFMAARDGRVQIRRDDGKVVSIPITTLSSRDRQWVDAKLNAIASINLANNHEPTSQDDRQPETTQQIVWVKTHLTAPAGPARIEDTFEPFAKLKALEYRRDADFFYVESRGMPDHRMMVGITAWQQQVPLPQAYVGDNAWRIPLHPVVAKQPLSAKNHFFRGAIALAANGIPIFNPIKNDGRTDTFLAGELDEFGGHCGRADDYHYHTAPLHLQEVVGPDRPIAYALDGYPIYGLTEPDGSDPVGLDGFRGHETPELGYHYHSSKSYPYIQGGFHGEVTERDGQVDPQPRAEGVRPALPPLRGAVITDFEAQKDQRYHLEYRIGRDLHRVDYQIADDGTVSFQFADSRGKVTQERYQPKPPRPNPNRPNPPRGREDRNPRDPNRPNPDRPNGNRPAPDRNGVESVPARDAVQLSPKKSGDFQLTSPAFDAGKRLPKDFTGDGDGISPPLAWRGAPEGTQSFAIVMDHLDRDQVVKTYWILYDIPADATSLSQDAQNIGKFGATWKRDQSYVPPRSAGPGEHRYTIHIYALSKKPPLEVTKGTPTRDQLLNHIRDSVLDSADIDVLYARPDGANNNRNPPPPRPRRD